MTCVRTENSRQIFAKFDRSHRTLHCSSAQARHDHWQETCGWKKLKNPLSKVDDTSAPEDDWRLSLSEVHAQELRIAFQRDLESACDVITGQGWDPGQQRPMGARRTGRRCRMETSWIQHPPSHTSRSTGQGLPINQSSRPPFHVSPVRCALLFGRCLP